MATQKATTRRAAQLETDPQRVAVIFDTINAMLEQSPHVGAPLTEEAPLRALAARLRVPRLALEQTALSVAGITTADVDEYSAWRAAVESKGA